MTTVASRTSSLMEPRNPLDNLITASLRDRLGPPPSQELWQRIARDIAPPRRSIASRLRLIGGTPLVQSALMIVMLFALLAQPAIYWQQQKPLASPAMLSATTFGRPLPEADLVGRDMAALHDDEQSEPMRALTAQ